MSALSDPRHDDSSVGHQAPAPCLAAPAAPAALATPAFFVLSEVCGSLPLVRMGRGRWKEGGCEREGGGEGGGGRRGKEEQQTMDVSSPIKYSSAASRCSSKLENFFTVKCSL